MRVFRILVLLLVCVLLPFRGAVAATVLCAESSQTSGLTAAAGHAHHGLHGGEHVHGVGAHADHGQAGHDTTGANDKAKADRCHLCVSGCHAAAMVTASPSTPGAMPVAAVVFPALNVPMPDFESGGQDRPPRAI